MECKVISLDELNNVLGHKKVAIYGAGYVAVRMYKALRDTGRADNIDCFVTTSGSDSMVEGLKVEPIANMVNDIDRFICVAVHESILEEIVEVLDQRGICDYAWITPLFFDVMIGKAIALGRQVAMKDIIAANTKDFAIAARYAAIEQYFGKNDSGYDIYLKMQSLYSDEKTANKRLEQFKSLIKSWNENGYDATKPSVIMDDYVCIDGLHRIALAAYYGMERISCDVYPATKSINEVHNSLVHVTHGMAYEIGLSQKQIDIMNNCNEKIRKGYGF